MATTTPLNKLTINYLTQAQYDTALSGGTLEANQLYMTPGGNGGEKIITSTSEASNPTNYPAGTIWMQYGSTPPADRDDYVTEQGTSGIWTYRKWNSGISECWGTKTVTGINVSSTWGSVYFGQASATSGMTYPSGLFTAAPEVQVYLRAQGGRFWATHNNDATATNVGTIYAIAPASYTSQTIIIHVYSIGTWK